MKILSLTRALVAGVALSFMSGITLHAGKVVSIHFFIKKDNALHGQQTQDYESKPVKTYTVEVPNDTKTTVAQALQVLGEEQPTLTNILKTNVYLIGLKGQVIEVRPTTTIFELGSTPIGVGIKASRNEVFAALQIPIDLHVAFYPKKHVLAGLSESGNSKEDYIWTSNGEVLIFEDYDATRTVKDVIEKLKIKFPGLNEISNEEFIFNKDGNQTIIPTLSTPVTDLQGQKLYIGINMSPERAKPIVKSHFSDVALNEAFMINLPVYIRLKGDKESNSPHLLRNIQISLNSTLNEAGAAALNPILNPTPNAAPVKLPPFIRPNPRGDQFTLPSYSTTSRRQVLLLDLIEYGNAFTLYYQPDRQIVGFVVGGVVVASMGLAAFMAFTKPGERMYNRMRNFIMYDVLHRYVKDKEHQVKAVAKLKNIERLRKAGTLTQKDFDAKKARVLQKFSPKLRINILGQAGIAA